MFHADKKPYAPRRHTLEVPFYSECDMMGDAEAEGACGGFYIAADHGRLGGYMSNQRMRDSGTERSEQLVVMRKLNLSERRDSFKKQEAVQEVSFDEPEEKSSSVATGSATAPGAQMHQLHRKPWMITQSQSREDVELEVPAVRRFTLVPQIAVQGSTESEDQDEWEPCSDGEESTENLELDVSSSPQQQPEHLSDRTQAVGSTSTSHQNAPASLTAERSEATPQKEHTRK